MHCFWFVVCFFFHGLPRRAGSSGAAWTRLTSDFGTVSGCPVGSWVPLTRAFPWVHLFVFSQAISYTYLVQISLLYCITVLFLGSVCGTNGRFAPLAIPFRGRQSWFTEAHVDTLSCLELFAPCFSAPPPRQQPSAHILGGFGPNSGTDARRSSAHSHDTTFADSDDKSLSGIGHFPSYTEKKTYVKLYYSWTSFTMNYFPAQGPNHVFG